MSVSNQSKFHFRKDMFDNCADSQQWKLNNNNGSQVICSCQVEKEDNIQNDGKVVATIDVGIQTPPLKRSSPSMPNAPKRKLAKFNSRDWKNEGSDIRHHLFDFQDLEIIENSKHKNWAILKIDTIMISKEHHCICRFYIGNKNGVNYLEKEFYPCIKYANISKEYRRLFRLERDRGHKLLYNPRQRSPPCVLAVEMMKQYV